GFRCRRRPRSDGSSGWPRPRGAGAAGHLAHEAVLVELVDELLEFSVEALADLLGDLAEGGAAVDRGQHRAIAPFEETGLAGCFLNSLPRLGVDRAWIHCFGSYSIVPNRSARNSGSGS